MEQIIALVLGVIASRLQGNWLKTPGDVSEKKRIWFKRLRFGIGMLASISAGFVAYFYGLWQDGSGLNDTTTILANIGLAFTASQTYYNTYFKLKN